jgi:ATP-binding cassette subfamily B protein
MTRHYFVPDVPQTSSMDCGLAALKCVLDGHNISVSQRRLAEFLQPALQMTTIDRLAEVAAALGLTAELVTAPIDHWLLDEDNLPAIVLARRLDGSPYHRFLVVWRKHGSFLQVMDPATGSRWLPQQRLLDELDIHTRAISAQNWRDGATASGFVGALRGRLLDLKLAQVEVERLTNLALADSTWRSLATLDAATRAVDAGVRAGGWESGAPAATMVARFLEKAQRAAGEDLIAQTNIPQNYWSVLPQSETDRAQPDNTFTQTYHSPPTEANTDKTKGSREKTSVFLSVSGEDREERLAMRGVTFLRVSRTEAAPEEKPLPRLKGKRALPRLPKLDVEKDPQFRAERELWHALRADGLLTPQVLTAALAVAAVAVALEALLLQGIMQLGTRLGLAERIGAIGMLLAFFGALVLLELPINSTVMRMGRRLETRLRIALLEKIPRLSNRYFVGNPIADLNRRAYALRELRETPDVGASLLRASFQLLLTAGCVIWLESINLPLVILNVVFVLGISRFVDPFVGVPIYRCFIHANTLNHFYLDSLLGLLPARTHSAERAIRREHESTLVDLIHADSQLTLRFGITFLVITAVPTAIVVWIVFNYVARGGAASNLLLLTYWAFNLPLLTERIGRAMVQYLQRCRPAALMLCQVLDAPEETAQATENQPTVILSEANAERLVRGNETLRSAQGDNLHSSPAVSIHINDVTVQVGKSTLLANINLAIAQGEHIAVVGASGAGKTSMVGLLLGWHRPTSGSVLVDGAPLEGERLYDLRRQTAWVDTGVQLWNRSLLSNLHYGTRHSSVVPLGETIAEADLFNVLTTLPNGLQTPLGESGRLVSGGEGQRVRLGRALFRSDVCLVILDEPFRALDRKSRRALLARARQHWQAATMILISHDVGDVQGFERVLVMEGGRIVEDGVPDALAAQPTSRYRALLDSEAAAQQALWGSTEWRRFWLGNGQLSENGNGNGQNTPNAR